MLLDNGDLFVEGFEGGLNLLLHIEAGEGPVTGLDTLLHGRQVLVGLVLLLFERVNADVVGFNLLG